MTKSISDHIGTYTGFSPTDSSKIALGEIELTITQETLTIRHATGLRIEEAVSSIEQIRQLSEDEMREQFQDGSDAHQDTDGFQVGEGAILLFCSNVKEDEPPLIIRLGEFIEMLGITVLFHEQQVAAGVFEKIVTEITKQVGEYPFPRLQYEGLHEPKKEQ